MNVFNNLRSAISGKSHHTAASDGAKNKKGGENKGDLKGVDREHFEKMEGELQIPHLYFVSEDETRKFNLYAIAPALKENGRLEWRDTSRGASIAAMEILLDGVDYRKTSERHPKEIQITSVDGEHVVLKLLTNEYYEEHLREYTEGQPKFKNSDEIQGYYLNNF